MKDVFELPIHQQIAPRCILEKDQGRTVIENRLEARFALAEFRRDTVTIGHVLNLRNEIEGATVHIPDQRHIQLNPDDLAELVNVAFLHMVGRNLTGEQLLDIGQISVQIIRMGDGLEIRREQFLLRIADNVTQRAIDLQPVPIRTHERHPDRRIPEGAGKLFLTFPQRLFRS